MDEPVAHARLVDIAALRIGYREMAVSAVPIRTVTQVGMERKNSIHETQ